MLSGGNQNPLQRKTSAGYIQKVVLTRDGIFRLYDMTAQQIVNDLILDNQNLVIEELMKHDDSIWDSLQNFNENSEVLEWWLVTPYMADMLKNNGEVILAAYDCYWWGRQTSGQGLSMDWVIQKIAEDMSM